MPKKKKVKNKISLLLHKAVVDSNDVRKKDELIKEMQKTVNPKRLTGLINNNYEIRVDEVNSISKTLGCSIEELVEL